MTTAAFQWSEPSLSAVERRQLSSLASVPASTLLKDSGEFNANNASTAIRAFAAMVATACVITLASGPVKEAVTSVGNAIDNYTQSHDVTNGNLSNSGKIKTIAKPYVDPYVTGDIAVHGRDHHVENVLTDTIAKTWKIPVEMSRKIVDLSFREGTKADVDPLLVLSIIAVESSFRHQSRSSVGAEGVMQVWRKWHKEKFAAETATADPIQKNIRIGIKVLEENLHRSDNNFREALQRYNGTLKDDTGKYSNKVIAMHSSFKKLYTDSSNHYHKEVDNVKFTLNGGFDLNRKVRTFGNG